MLPLILFATGVVYLNHMRARDAAFDRVVEVVRATRLVLDTEMRGVTLALEVLGNTRALQNDDLEGLSRQRRRPFSKTIPASRSRSPPATAGRS